MLFDKILREQSYLKRYLFLESKNGEKSFHRIDIIWISISKLSNFMALKCGRSSDLFANGLDPEMYLIIVLLS